MKSRLFLLLAFFSCFFRCGAQGTAFSYQGRLTVGGFPANGRYSLRFALFDAGSNGNPSGTPVTNTLVEVQDGLFTVSLDFGNGRLDGADRWIEIGVRGDGENEFTTLQPRQHITPTPYAIVASGLAGVVAHNSFGSDPYITIGGGSSNSVAGAASTVSGGYLNSAVGSRTTVSGGLSNQATNDFSVVAGGQYNVSGGPGSTIGGGSNNSSIEKDTTVGGGLANRATGPYATIAGGFGNLASGRASTVTGGQGNSSSGDYSTAMGYGSTAYGRYSTVSGGGSAASGESSVAFGASARATGNYSFAAGFMPVAGGTGAVALGSETQANGDYSFASGFRSTATGNYATAIGNLTHADGNDSVALGAATVAGPFSMACGFYASATNIGSFVWADHHLSDFTTTADNQFLVRASGGVGIGTPSPQTSVHIASPEARLRLESTLAAAYSAIEYSTPDRVWHTGIGGSAVVNQLDNKYYIYDATAGQIRFVISTNGFVGIGSSSPQGALHVSSVGTTPQFNLVQEQPDEYARITLGVTGRPRWTVSVEPTATPTLNFWNGSANVAYLNYNGALWAQSFNPISDRNAKENFQTVSPRSVLEKVVGLAITRWNFKTAPGEEHIGPMAQDFRAAFGTGPDDRHIATVDADGVALAAIQGLNQKLEETRRENEDLRQRLARLEKILLAQTATHP